MRGRIAARTAARDLAVMGAWQTERFAREERLKPLGHYLKADAKAAKTKPKVSPTASRGQAMLAGLLAHRQAGAPITIRRLLPAKAKGRS